MSVMCSGEGLVYMMDEEVGCLELSHKLSVSSRDFPGEQLLPLIQFTLYFVSVAVHIV